MNGFFKRNTVEQLSKIDVEYLGYLVIKLLFHKLK